MSGYYQCQNLRYKLLQDFVSTCICQDQILIFVLGREVTRFGWVVLSCSISVAYTLMRSLPSLLSPKRSCTPWLPAQLHRPFPANHTNGHKFVATQRLGPDSRDNYSTLPVYWPIPEKWSLIVGSKIIVKHPSSMAFDSKLSITSSQLHRSCFNTPAPRTSDLP